MVEVEKKEVVFSAAFEEDLTRVFEFGEEIFGFSAARIFVADIYSLVLNLDTTYLEYSECRYIRTKSKMYRNIIFGTYLIIYRITSKRVEVLRLFNSRISVRKIRTIRKSKL
jgi:toxin ParE1/3/4